MNTLNGFIENFNWSYVLIGAAAVLTITFHELSHGFIAYMLGDSTAKNLGRLSLNPFKHIDIVGLVMLIVFGFGWAKPVPIDMRNFKNPKWGMAVTALAGPAANFLLAFLSMVLMAILFAFKNELVYSIINFLYMFASISVGLGLFNLIPIPPLDGSKIVFSLFPDKAYYKLMQYERYGMILLIIVLNTDIISPYLQVARSFILDVIWVIASTPFYFLFGTIFN